jgi:5,10-methylene-tetrahydrofolate dehydrogenase/methenyl tetrahydrofolate cyclohydrolase
MSNNKINSSTIKTQVAEEIFVLNGERPNAAIILVGESHKYLKKIKKLEKEAKEVGVDTHLYICDEDSSEEALNKMIELFNEDDLIDAVYIQRPLPSGLKADNLFNLIKFEKQIEFEDDFNQIDWEFFEANFFKNVLSNYKERNALINN